MRKYEVTEERLIELYRAELKQNLADNPLDHEHYQVNKDYWEEALLCDERVLAVNRYEDGVQIIPEASPLMEVIKPNFNKRMERLAHSYESDEFLKYILQMDQQDVYGLFNESIDTLDGAEWICGIICHGLYDDGEVGVVKSPWAQGYHIAQVGDDYNGRTIYEEDLWELIKAKQLASTYYAANKKIIEDQNAPRLGDCTAEEFRNSPKRLGQMEYYRLDSIYDDLLEVYMNDECKAEKQSARAATERKMADLRARVAAKKEASCQ